MFLDSRLDNNTIWGCFFVTSWPPSSRSYRNTSESPGLSSTITAAPTAPAPPGPATTALANPTPIQLPEPRSASSGCHTPFISQRDWEGSERRVWQLKHTSIQIGRPLCTITNTSSWSGIVGCWYHTWLRRKGPRLQVLNVADQNAWAKLRKYYGLTDKTHHVQAAGTLPEIPMLEEHCSVDPLTFILLLDHKPETTQSGKPMVLAEVLPTPTSKFGIDTWGISSCDRWLCMTWGRIDDLAIPN